jgi:heme exporter protein B
LRHRAPAGRGSELGGVSALAALLVRDTRVAVRVGGSALMGVLFFLLVMTMMPFGIGPDLKLLARIGPAILWLGALLAALLGLDRLLAADHDDGSLDLILMSHAPLELSIATKAFAHWLTTGLPLVLAAPLLGMFLNVEIGAIGLLAAVAVALERGGLLMPILILPLTVPVLIFGVAASEAAALHTGAFGTPFLILVALTLMSVVVGPFAAAAVLRHGID